MDSDNARSLSTFEAAMVEFAQKGKVETVRCERCHGLIDIRAKSSSSSIVKCQCGAYNDTLRGL